MHLTSLMMGRSAATIEEKIEAASREASDGLSRFGSTTKINDERGGGKTMKREGSSKEWPLFFVTHSHNKSKLTSLSLAF
jgi:hypothetical protein